MCQVSIYNLHMDVKKGRGCNEIVYKAGEAKSGPGDLGEWWIELYFYVSWIFWHDRTWIEAKKSHFAPAELNLGKIWEPISKSGQFEPKLAKVCPDKLQLSPRGFHKDSQGL